MLYSIIPPALVVMSLVGIIIFLMKKAPEVARLEDKPILISAEEQKEQELSARYAALKKENRKSFKDVAAASGVKTMGILKKAALFFGKFFTSGKSALGRINDGAKAKLEAGKLSKRQSLQKEESSDFFQRQAGHRMEVIDEEEYMPEEAATITEAVQPRVEKKVEKKDLFEKILIDRIAGNPKDIEAYERLGEYYLEIESWNYAKECFKQVIKLNPRNIGARSRMRRLEKILGKR